jgi:hypothetical protein
MAALEAADERGVVNLRGAGRRDAGAGLAPVQLSYKAELDAYDLGGGVTRSGAQLRAEAQTGALVVLLTAHLRDAVGRADALQPLLSTSATGTGATGDPPLPVLPAGNPMTLIGVAVRADAAILVDGQPVAGTVSCVGGTFSPVYCSSDRISVQLAATPANGLRLLQLQSPRGPVSNELPICVGAVSGCR